MIMKKALLSFLLIACAFLNELNAQCSILDITTTGIQKSQDGNGNCIVTFNMTIKAQLNGGNKGIWVHLWNAADYPVPSWNYSGSAPSATFLSTSNAIATLGVNNSGTSPVVVTSYPFDNSAPVTMATANAPTISSTGSGSSTIYIYTFTNVSLKLTGNNCTIPPIKADVWSTNANSLGPNTKPQCTFLNRDLNVGSPSLNLTTPFKNCKGSLGGTSLNFNITTDSPTPITVSFQIRKDDGLLQDNKFVYNPDTDGNVTTGGAKTATISASNPYQAVSFTDFTGANLPGDNADYWVIITYTPAGGTAYNLGNITSNSCASTLPVNFKSFTASRANSASSLKWTTSTEVNSKGFYVQRFYNGQWENVMYIASKADGGNSTTDLNYTYNDVFNFKGVVQYRILQVDLDGKAKYSVVRSLSNGSQAGGVLLYPNPASSNGNISIVLADATSSYDIQIVDNSGRIVKEFSSVRSTQQVSNLPKGQYLARVKERESNQVSVEKFIVQ
jgi:hypothetical protein